MKGIIVWGSIVIINLATLLVLQLIRRSRVVPTKDIFLAAGISDVLVHILIAITTAIEEMLPITDFLAGGICDVLERLFVAIGLGIGEMLMWAMISFPIVAVPSLIICFLGKLAYDRLRSL